MAPTRNENDPLADGPELESQFATVYDELKRMARSIRAGKAGETLNATALVHEAYLKLSSSAALEVSDSRHLVAIAARAMRQILVDAARRKGAQKRGGGAALVTLSEDLYRQPLGPGALLALNQALEDLEEADPRKARVVECRIFAGLSNEEIAALLDVSRPTVDRDWRAARAWLATELEGSDQ